MSTMRALHLAKSSPASPPSLALLSLPIPILTPGHVLVKIHASPIHPSDLLNSKGAFLLTTYPRIPGRDFSGTIHDSDDPSSIGKAVYGTSGSTLGFTIDGAHAEYILIPSSAVVETPSTLSWVQAATVGVPFTTASVVLKKASVKEGETVLVLGANGAVGSAVVQLALANKCVVLQATRNDKGDVNTASDPSLSSLDGKKIDVVIDTVGIPSLTAAAVSKLGLGGRLVFIAAPRSGSTELGIDMLDFYRKGKTVVGVNTLLFGVEEMARELEGMREWFESGALKGSGEGEWNEVPLEDGVGAYVQAGERGKGKFVLVMQ